jgi:hypothetical protein
MNALVKTVELSDAFCPDNGPPRLIRFNLPDAGTGVIATLDVQHNLLRVNKEKYDKLDSLRQHVVLKTLKPVLHIADLQF